MKSFLFVIIFGTMGLFSMERQETERAQTALTINTEYRSPFDDSNHSQDDEDELCDIAMQRFESLGQYVKPYLKNMLKEPSESPMRRDHSNAQILRKIKSGEDHGHYLNEVVHEMVVKATSQAFIEKEQELAIKEQRIKEKYSGKKTAAIAAITATISTVITTICTVVVTINSKK